MLAFIQIPSCACRELEGNQLKALAGLQQFADREGLCFPGQRRLAKLAGLAPTTLNRALRELEALKVISVRRRGGNKTNVYRIAERYRVRRAAATLPPAQGDLFETPCSASGAKGIAKQDSTSIANSESLNAARVKEKQQKRDPEGGRCAPLAGIEAEGLLETWNEPAAPVARRAGFVPISATVKRLPRPAGCARTPALKSKIKSQLDMKHARYLAARGRPGEVGAYWEARLGEPEAAQRVFDEVDLRMRRSGWDDMREWKRQRGIAP